MGGWERTKQDIKQGDLQVRHGQPTIAGTYSLEAVTGALPFPVGVIWYRWTAQGDLEILNSWVKKEFRRCGVRTQMHKFLIRYYEVPKHIVTAGGSEEGSEWMESMGYRKMKGDWWQLTIRRKRAKKKKKKKRGR